jgi:hypothetical protein
VKFYDGLVFSFWGTGSYEEVVLVKEPTFLTYICQVHRAPDQRS